MNSSISGFQNDKQECHTDYKYPDSGYLSVCMAFYDRLYSDGIYFVSSLILPVFTFGSIKFVYA